MAASKVSATDGAWQTTATGGIWGVPGNWEGNVIANGVDALADFSKLNITANNNVSLGGNFTVGRLKFADTTASNNWGLVNGTGGPWALTLESTAVGGPTIEVGSNVATISAVLAGTQGFTLSGAGTLRLTGANTLTGGIRLTAGSDLGFTGGGLGTNLVELLGNAQFTWQGTNTQDVSSQLKFADGIVATLSTGGNNVTLATAFQLGPLGTTGITKVGGGDLTLTAANTFTGVTRINVGRIVLAGGDNRLAATGTILLGQNANNGVLQLGNATSASNQTTTSLTTAGSGTANAVVGGNAAVSTLTINNTAAVTYAGLLGGAGANENNLALAKSGTGALTLTNGGNTFSGGVTLLQGSLTFSSGALGSVGNIVFAAASTLQWAAGNTQDLSPRLVLNDGVIATLSLNANTVLFATPLQTGPLGTGGLIKGDGGTLVITAVNTFTGTTRINNGRMILAGGDNRLSMAIPLQFGNAANSGVLQLGDASGASHQTVTSLGIVGTGAANAVVGGAATNSIFTVNNAANILGTGSPILGGAGVNENNLALVKSGAGSLVLSKTNTFTGNVDVVGGALIVTNNSSLGSGAKTVTVSGTENAPSLQLSNASGVVVGAGISLVTSNDDATAPAIVNNSGQNTIAGTITLTDGGFGGGHTRIKVNGGTLTLNGHIAAAATALSDRTLILDGDAEGAVNGTISDTGAIRVAVTKEGAGTWTLNAANTYTGNTTVNGGRLNLTTAQTGTGAIVVGNGAALGVKLSAEGQSLKPGALTLNTTTEGTTLSFDFGSFTEFSAPLIVTGAFSTGAFETSVIDIFGTGLSIGTFDLISYTGAIGGGGFEGLKLGSKPARVTANLFDAPGKVQLVISTFDFPKWRGKLEDGEISGLWDVNDEVDPSVGSGTANWVEVISGLPTRYLQSGGLVDSVLFDDTADGTRNVELTTTLSPTSVTVDVSGEDYLFYGSGKLTGATSLLKTGTSALILINTGGNDFTGTTTINGGRVQVGNGLDLDAGQLGSGAIVIGANGTLALARPSGPGQDLTLANVISGTGQVIQEGGNTVTLSANNSGFDGTIEVASGILKLGGANALGSTIGGTTVREGAVLDVTGFSISEAILLDGGTLAYLSGASVLNGALTLDGGGIIDGAAGTLTINAPITGTGTLVKENAGNLIISGLISIAGGFTSNGGTVTLSNANTFTGGLTVNAGIVILSANQAYTGGTTVGGGGTLQLGAAAALVGAPGAGNIALDATSGVAALNILRGGNFELANNITSSGANETNTVTIGAGGAGSASGIVTFSGANTFTGNVTVTGGALRITNSSALGVGPKVVRIASNAGPALRLDATSGNIVLASGIRFQISSGGGVDNFAANSGSIINIAGDNVINGTISLINGGGGQGRLMVEGGTLTVNGNIDADTASGARTLQIGGAGNGTINGVISDFNSTAAVSPVGITKDGSGVWTLNGVNTFTAGVAVQDGTLRLGSVAASGTAQPLGAGTAAVTIGTATTTGTLEYIGATDGNLGRAITVNGAGGGVLKNSGGAEWTLSGTITRASRPLTFAGGAFHVTGQITGASSTLTIDGAAVTLSQTTNNYVGNTAVLGGGVVRNGASNVLPDGTTVVLGEAAGNTGGTYDLNGFDETVTGVSSAGTGTRVVTNNAAAGTATLTVSGTSTFAGEIKDGATAEVALRKSTGGTFTLSGANTYTGATAVDGGTLLVGGSLNGTAAVQVNSGGTLGGNGSVTTGDNGNVTVAAGGNLAPGLGAAGTLTLDVGVGQLDASAAGGGTGWIKFELGTASDRIVLTTGTLNLGIGFDLDDFVFSNTGGFGEGTYTLFETNSEIVGILGTHLTGTVLGFDATLGFADNNTDIVLTVSSVPEPGASLSLMAGLGSLLGLQRLRRKNRRLS